MNSQSAREREASELIGSVLAGRYRVEKLLGEGGMGRVYLAEHVLMRKPVALKVLHPEMTVIPDVVARFEREAVAAARIDHANVAQAMDFGHLADGALYFVLEYVDGRSLRALLTEGALELDRALGVARQVASALVAAHHVGIVHRDLKPDNVMLVEQPDGTDRVKVLDFGIAKLTAGDGEAAVPGKTLTRVGVVMGTVGYMAPEQALGQTVSHLADLYAFGSMLYEMLSGHLPFEAEELTQILTKQLTEEPPPLPATVPSELALVTQKLLSRNAAERVQTAQELADALERIAQHRTVAAAPTAFITEPMDVPALSGRLAVARTTTPGTPAKRSSWMVAGALLLVGLGTFAVLRTKSDGEPGPTASASAPLLASSATPAALASSATPEAAAVSAPTPSAEKPETLAPVEVSPPPAAETRRTETSSERTTTNGRTKHTRRTHVTEEHTVKRTHRRTGPGGIYIPPPSQWFR